MFKPFTYRYNLTDVNTGVKFPVELSLAKRSWIKITLVSLAPLALIYGAGAVARMTEKKDTLTEDSTMTYPNHTT